ncbi:MAG: hypothetical protein M1825_004070 [Sarcosagium campestre]|nr:MAG: hypothetical protein M1825_004070 [Sarcosagium campestre]
MTTTTPLQLFPPPPGKNRPKRKASRRKTTATVTSSAATITECAKSPARTEGIVIHVSNDADASSGSDVSPEDAVGSLPLRSDTPTGRPAPPRSVTASPAPTDAASRFSTCETLVRSNSVNVASSSVAPNRSIFPRYDPSVPLSQQNYRPTQASPTHIPRGMISKDPYSPNLYSPQSPGHANNRPTSIRPTSSGRAYMNAPATAPSSMTSFPSGILSVAQPRFSSTEELADLWEAANGQGTEEKARTFALRMSRDGTFDQTTGAFQPTASEAFTFGPSKDQPFYDLQTLKANDFDTDFCECNIRRRDPQRGTIVPVLTLNIEPPSRRQPPDGDGLVTTIYPKLAALMALDTETRRRRRESSTSVTAATSTDSVAAKESCRLLFDRDSQRYYLHHPGLSDSATGGPRRFNVLIDAAGCGAGFDLPGARGTIRLVDPSSQSTLVALEFGTATLLINTAATEKLASLYIVDVAVATVLAVSLVEGRRFRPTTGGLASPCLSPRALSTIHSPLSPRHPPDLAPSHLESMSVSGPPPAQAAIDPGAGPKSAGVFVNVLHSIVWLISIIMGALAGLVVGVSTCLGGGKK